MELKKTANEGMILTNGEVYGKSISLGVNDSIENWWEITEEEYAEIVASQVTNDEYAEILAEQEEAL
jgi:hypothetical protein